MHHALAGVDVLRQLDLAHRVGADRSDRRHQPLERVERRRQQLTRCRAASHRSCVPSRKNPSARAAHVQPRAHPVALLRRCRRRPPAPAASSRPMRANASAITWLLIVELPRIGDVRVEAAAAQRIAGRPRGDPATAPRSRPRRRAPRPCHALDARAAPLARNRARRRARRARRGARSSARRRPASRWSSGMTSPGFSIGSREARSIGSLSTLAHQAIDRPRRARARTRRRSCRSRTPASSASASRASDAARRLVERRRAPAAPARRRARRAARAAPAAPRRAGRRPWRAPRRARAAARSISASNASPSDPLARADVSRSTTRSRCAGSD